MIGTRLMSIPLALLCGATALAEPQRIQESARDVPVAYQVDLVVVGGSTGAVAAATAAAESGAKVFLATPWPYLGEDMAGTLRLWLEEGEQPATPLARRVYQDPTGTLVGPDPNRISFTYTTDRPSGSAHKDTTPPSLLSDGQWQDASKQSVQFEGDVAVIADLGASQPITEVRLMAFHRESSEPKTAFKVERVLIQTSDDGKTWRKAGEVKNADAPENPLLKLPVPRKARYVKLNVKQAADAGRILLGEVEIIGEPKQTVAASEPPMPRPMHVKKVLDEALLAAKVQYLYGCFATDVVRDQAGKPCGIVMANRAGRQAVLAKVVIDATDRAWVTRQAGARFRSAAEAAQPVSRVVIGGEVQKGNQLKARVIPPPFHGPHPNRAKTSSGIFNVIEYTLQLPLDIQQYASWCRAEQAARSATYHPEQQFTADAFFQVPPDPIVGRTAPQRPEAAKPQAANLSVGAEVPLEACRPEGVDHWFVLGGCVDLPRPEAERLLRPIALIDLGTRVGKAAAAEARRRGKLVGAAVPGKPEGTAIGEIRETLTGVRPIQQLPTIRQEARGLPVLGQYDVVVIGGGTGGAPAGIAAARQKAKTLVVEYLHGLGGVGTIGAISSYYWGNRVGFSATVPGGNSWVIEQKAEWWRKALVDAGGELWYGAVGCGALVQDGVVRGAIVATPQGRGVVLAGTVIDSTGNADIAAAAGAQTAYTDHTELAMQGTGLPGRQLGGSYANTDFNITDETDMVDVWHMYVYAKSKYADAFDQGQLVDTRERRRIVGDFTMSILDQMNGRTYPDTICVAYSNFDTHGYTVDPYLELEHPEHKGFRVSIPYRCLLPANIDRLLVTGLGISVHRDAVPLVRMQADVQNQGYAAGVAAAMAVKAGTPLRKINLRTLQQHLIDVGNLPPTVLTDKDSYPLADKQLDDAVASIKDDFRGAAVLLAHPDRALPRLRKAYEAAAEKDKLTYAQILAVLGDRTGVPTLVSELAKIKAWDQGWNYRGMGQFGRAFSRADQLIIALGRSGDPRGVEPVIAKLRLLDSETDFSHHRAVGIALELLGEPAAAKPLAGLLTQPGMAGYIHDTIEEAQRRDREAPGGTNEVKTRRDSIRELLLARALYRCGDYGDIGKQTLLAYTRDLRGHLARHAKAVLDKGPKR